MGEFEMRLLVDIISASEQQKSKLPLKNTYSN